MQVRELIEILKSIPDQNSILWIVYDGGLGQMPLQSVKVNDGGVALSDEPEDITDAPW
jgi:hypothetical protein